MKVALIGLLALAGLQIGTVQAQTAWTKCADEGGSCTITAEKLVRYGQPFTPAWLATRTIAAGTFACTNAYFGTDPSPGTGKRCEVMDALPSIPNIEWVLTWTHATARADGTPLTDRIGYRIDSALPDGPWQEVARVGADQQRASIALPPGTRRFRVATLSSSGDSSETPDVTATRPRGSAPLPPTDAGVPGSELALVSGASTGLRAVYASTATRSRGPKIGDLAVGTTTQTDPPFNRVQCSRADRIVSGSTTYYRVTDLRVPTQYRGGYVAGCVSYGVQ